MKYFGAPGRQMCELERSDGTVQARNGTGDADPPLPAGTASGRRQSRELMLSKISASKNKAMYQRGVCIETLRSMLRRAFTLASLTTNSHTLWGLQLFGPM